MPQFILERSMRMKETVKIIVTQPRKIAAKSVAKVVHLAHFGHLHCAANDQCIGTEYLLIY